jgi:hypothetical protein
MARSLTISITRCALLVTGRWVLKRAKAPDALARMTVGTAAALPGNSTLASPPYSPSME